MGPQDVLPGNMQYPPTPGQPNSAVIKRTADCIEYTVETSGLPEGAYTNWLLVINNPEQCTVPNGCGIGDYFGELFSAPQNNGAFFATGGVVGANGRGSFSRRVCRGDDLGFPGEWMNFGDISRCKDGDSCTQAQVIGPQHLFGQLTNPKKAAVAIIVKYHGLASPDPATLYDQTHTLLGSCAEGANGLGIQCFDPQMAIFPGPR